jgi:excinuclease ABC subunit A
MKLTGATGNNLKNVSIELPLGKLICVTGVSGSGKSTLINETLYPILNTYYFNGVKNPNHIKKNEGLDLIDKVIIDQSPIGRTPRSNPAEVFTEIRKLFTMTSESMIRGYKAGRFSFNVKADAAVSRVWSAYYRNELLTRRVRRMRNLSGKRFNRETLEIVSRKIHF